MSEQSEILDLTADIVVSYVGNNSVASSELADLIIEIHKALVTAAKGETDLGALERLGRLNHGGFLAL